jgi:hypothetical protein
MLRQFTADIGRYKKGAKHDYPNSVWSQIARNAKKPLDSFTKEIEDNPALVSMHRGAVKRRARLGQPS